ncbi:MAG: hypothetical protein WBP94_15785 [Rhodomicrobiaceae bacterium]
MIDMGDHEREAIEFMLPWYEKGTLSAGDMRRVEAYLAAHPELNVRLALVREESEETVAANESLGMPMHSARDRLMAKIAAEGGAAPAASGGYKARLLSWLPGNLSAGLTVAAALAALIIVVQAAVLVSLVPGETDGGGYRVASGKAQAVAAGTFVLVRFADGATAGQIAALLESMHGTIVDGPKPGGVFKIRLSSHVLTDEQREAVLNTLRQKTDIVTFAAPAG